MTTRRQSLLQLAALAPMLAAPAAWGAAGKDEEGGETLKALAARKGLRFGNAIGTMNDKASRTHFNNPAYRALMARECGVLVAENESKWQALQPKPGPHDFRRADELFGWAKRQGMLIRGHCLVWQDPRWLPEWVTRHGFGANPAQEAERLLREHIAATCGHFGKDVYSYDVVNEAVNPGTGELIANALNEKMGALEQIDLSFRLAREHAPHAQLVYNDYMGPGKDSAKHRAGVLKLLAGLKARGTPVHALGLQSHIGAWGGAGDGEARARGLREWRAFLDEASGMGLDLLITEFDVSDRELPADIAQRDAAAAGIARDFLELTLSYPRCRDFLLWGLSDDVSWLQTWKDAKRRDGLPSRPCPYDAQLRAKPMRAAIADVLRTMPARAA
ncbi:endo-1,4-beta-xylanase [Pseudoduganella namucuonensis]|uniref:Beta-xylanase n=1 Tax=Pseudoduganella namucuonensis TaxID=1035707 RepID=A0A1I7H1D9_9BURK|nr:endo-1,4-beta-xylanase [Pseudoduganella namucuonensis]SFU54513.1 endo-1,4-beta-xylanase [Pseudoduganella namucuonensis]